eukprot:scaffold49956_cov63-Phaeocystis_antarctica.AAC.1
MGPGPSMPGSDWGRWVPAGARVGTRVSARVRPSPPAVPFTSGASRVLKARWAATAALSKGWADEGGGEGGKGGGEGAGGGGGGASCG